MGCDEIRTDRKPSAMRVARNSIILLVGEVFMQVISFLLGAFVARSLGVTRYGQYVAAFAFATVFTSFTNMGLDRLLTREMARRPADASALLRDAGAARLMLSVVVYLAMIGATYGLRFGAEARTASLLAGLVTVLNSLGDFLRTVFQAFERMEYQVLTRLSERVIAAGAVLVLVLRWPTALSPVCGLLAASVVAFAVTWVSMRRFATPQGRPAWKRSVALLRTAIPFGITATVLGVMSRIDPFLLSLCRPRAEVGRYGAAVSLVLPISVLPMVLTTALFPHISKLSIDDSAYTRTASELSLKWLLLLGLPIGVCLMSLADAIVILVFGTEFTGAIMPLRILGASVALTFGRILLSNVLAATDHQDFVAAVMVLQLVVSLLLNLSLIPRVGAVGAALSVVAYELFGFFSMLYEARRVGAIVSPHRFLVGLTLAACAMFAVVAGLQRLGAVSAALAGLLVYFLVLVRSRVVDRSDWLLASRTLVS